MKYFVALASAVALTAAFPQSIAGAEPLGAGRNGASGMSDRWSRPSESLERYGTDLEEDEDTPPLGAGRSGADGMPDPSYQPRPLDHRAPLGVERSDGSKPTEPNSTRPFGAGDAPQNFGDRETGDKSILNGH